MNYINNLIPLGAESWLLPAILKITAIVIGVLVINKILRNIIEKTVVRMVSSSHLQSEAAERKRENTLIKIFTTTTRTIVVLIGVAMALQTLSIPVGPILAAAGVAGVALGFGGQYLIRDIISGLFIILENQYRVDDIICSDGKCGTVEHITLRMTTLRDLDGNVHHIPHGEIKTVSNLSKSYSRVNLNVGVGYSSDLEKVKNVVNKVGQELSDDPEWSDSILKAPQFLRVDNFADSAIEIKILGDTLPAQQWAVTGELRLRLKNAFDREGIEMPFPQRVIHQSK